MLIDKVKLNSYISKILMQKNVGDQRKVKRQISTKTTFFTYFVLTCIQKFEKKISLNVKKYKFIHNR